MPPKPKFSHTYSTKPPDFPHCYQSLTPFMAEFLCLTPTPTYSHFEKVDGQRMGGWFICVWIESWWVDG